MTFNWDIELPIISSITLANTSGITIGTAETNDTIIFNFNEAIDATEIDSGLTSNGSFITGRLSNLVTNLGEFTTSASEGGGDTDSTLTLTNSTTITITLGTFATAPSGTFTPSSSKIKDTAGNSLATTPDVTPAGSY